MVRVSVGYNFVLCGPHWEQDQVGLHCSTLEKSRLNLSVLPTYTCRELVSQREDGKFEPLPSCPAPLVLSPV